MGKENVSLFRHITKSGFVRSVFMRVLSVFVIASTVVAAVAFYSFASEVRRNVLDDKSRQLASVESSISKRMGEITSIAYRIANDEVFYLDSVGGAKYSGYEMSNTLERYLAGNSFIEHLAFYRLSEPDKIYVSSGERSLSEFFGSSFGLSKEAVDGIIGDLRLQNKTGMKVIDYGASKHSYFSYVYPLPQLSANPQALVLMLIPAREVTPLFETLRVNGNGGVAVFDADGGEIYRYTNLEESISLDAFLSSDAAEKEYKSDSGTGYVLQKVTSDSNGWTYVSVIRSSDTLSGPANKHILIVVLLLLLVFAAVIVMLVGIIKQYKPISNLAATVAQSGDGDGNGMIDERTVLSDTFATLRDESEQKQKFESAYLEATAASKAKSAFLSNMSHDIRTPMNAVIGMTSLALKHADDPEYVIDCLKKVQISSRYLMDIINNVLDMSRIESGKITLISEPLDLIELADGLSVIVAPGAEAKSQQLAVNIGWISDRAVVGDSVRLSQAFVNILSNAVKFTPEGGKITMDMRQTGAENGFGDYVFTFTDTGIGMTPEFVGQVFDTFTRADTADISKVEGTGLGMAIAKSLVELMGGSISCESQLGKGTVFTVKLSLPLADKDAVSAAGAADKVFADNGVINLSGRRILLAEDNEINREIACRIIAETGAETVEAVDGKAAVNAFAEHPEGYFDIILMDLQMPVMNGYEATAAIRSMKRSDAKTVQIYAMTANTFDEDVRQVRDAGMNGHIGKPYTPESLFRVLSQVLPK